MNNFKNSLRDNEIAIYQSVCNLPIVSPHGHCDPSWFADNGNFENPSALLITPDHYVFRMLYSQGIPLEELGIGKEGKSADPREVFRLFSRHWHLFLGTPSRSWLDFSFKNVFGLRDPLSAENCDHFYDVIAESLIQDEFKPRALFERFNIEVLATTDGALDDLSHHKTIAGSRWSGRVVPTFRPDSILDPLNPNFIAHVKKLGELTNEDTHSFAGYIAALRSRRQDFKKAGATATDHAITHLSTEWLDEQERHTLFNDVISNTATQDSAVRFYGHMLIEMAKMSIDDGLVMQLHVGSTRSTNDEILSRFGSDMGADIPKSVNFVSGLAGLLNQVGNNRELKIILFTLDETTYARELAPMAGHWPALKLGPPWWFHDSENGIARYLEQVVETAGYWNLAGFNDDTRAFTSIPARHDLWRKSVANHLAVQISRDRLNMDEAVMLAKNLSYDFALDSYNLRLT